MINSQCHYSSETSGFLKRYHVILTSYSIIKLLLQRLSPSITFKIHRDYRLNNYNILILWYVTGLDFLLHLKTGRLKITMGRERGYFSYSCSLACFFSIYWNFCSFMLRGRGLEKGIITIFKKYLIKLLIKCFILLSNLYSPSTTQWFLKSKRQFSSF